MSILHSARYFTVSGLIYYMSTPPQQLTTVLTGLNIEISFVFYFYLSVRLILYNETPTRHTGAFFQLLTEKNSKNLIQYSQIRFSGISFHVKCLFVWWFLSSGNFPHFKIIPGSIQKYSATVRY